MTNDQAKNALINRTPVTHNGINYAYLSALIYRCNASGEIIISAELMDKSERSITIAQLKDVNTTHDNQNQATTILH